jgi:hypothetical protein
MRDTIDRAREAHKELVTKDYQGHIGQLDPWTLQLLKRFEALVRADAIADEREACAKVCEEYADDVRTGVTCATAIRARGNT